MPLQRPASIVSPISRFCIHGEGVAQGLVLGVSAINERAIAQG